MTNISILTIVLISVLTLALLFPGETLQIVAELKRQLRQKLVRRSGKQAAQELAQSFRSRALENGYDTELIEEVLEEHYGITMAAIGVGIAPAGYAGTTKARKGLEKIRFEFSLF